MKIARPLQHFFIALGLVVTAGCSSAQQTQDAVATNATNATNRYNVLFIAVDDLRPELGCYGADYVQTPNIDRLAATGTLFTQHFVTVPTCGASRYGLLTGRSPLNSGVTRGNADLYSGRAVLSQDQLPGAQTLPELFNRSGYQTVLIGKISHTADGKVYAYDGKGDGRDELPHAWDDLATPYGPWQRGWGVFFAYADGHHREDGQGHRDLMQFTVEHDTDLPDGLMAQRAIEKLAELKDREEPFFMGLGFFKPHLPFVAPRQDHEAVAKWDIPAPVFADGIDTAYGTRSGEFYGYNAPWQKTNPLAPDDAMQARRAYLACVRYTDRQVGKVLDALEEQGLADSTIVVLWGDHGWLLGEAAMWGKHTPLEAALHSPLIIRAPTPAPGSGNAAPGHGNAGRTVNTAVSTIDIYPTLVALAQPAFTATAHPLDGRDLTPLMRGQSLAPRPVVSSWGDAISLRTDTHRLIAKSSDGQWADIELYDLTEPGGAWQNVADDQGDTLKVLLDALPR